jgi:hypothetical protein
MKVRVSISKYLNYEGSDKIQGESKNREKNPQNTEEGDD